MKKITLLSLISGIFYWSVAQNLDFHENFSGLDDSQASYSGLVTWNLTAVTLGSLTGDAVILDAGGSQISTHLPGGISLFRCEMHASKTNSSIQLTIINSSGQTIYQNTFLTTKNTTVEVLTSFITPESDCTLTIENITNGGGDKSITIDDVSWDAFPIYDIQYTADPSGDSPQTGNIVSTAGTVTGVRSGGFYVQNTDGALDGTGSGDWSGIYIENAAITPSVMDFVTVTGTVAENGGRTSIQVNGTSNYDAQVTQPLGGNIPVPNLIVGALAEKDESVYSTIQASRYTAGDYAGGNYTMSIGFDAVEANNIPIAIDNDLYLTSEPSSLVFYELTGPVNYASYYRISPVDGSAQVAGGTITATAQKSDLSVRVKKRTLLTLAAPNSFVQVYNTCGNLVASFAGDGTYKETPVHQGIYLVSETHTNGSYCTKVRVP